MLAFFGTPWEDLSAEVVESFLAEAGDEGLTWEAKSEQPHRDSVRKAICGLANASGGFLIIGATSEESGGWALPGATFNQPEPGTWLSSVITQGLNPVPAFDIEVFVREDGRRAAIIGVEAVSMPPCVTASGVIYQRVTGQTLPVTDQRVLADLFARGRQVRERAEALALRASERALAEPVPLPADEALVSVALCPTEGPPDKAAVLFSPAFRDSMIEIVTARLQPEPPLRYSAGVAVHQDSLQVWPASVEMHVSWTAAAYWDGSVSAIFTAASSDLYVDDLVIKAHQAWRVLADLARNLGGGGEAHLAVRARAEHPAVVAYRRDHPHHPVQRWTEVREPTDDELQHIERELKRGFGQAVWEPGENAT